MVPNTPSATDSGLSESSICPTMLEVAWNS